MTTSLPQQQQQHQPTATSFFHGYYVVLATFVLNFVAIGTFNSAALFVVPLEKTFVSTGRGTIDFLPTIYLAVALFTAMGAGWLQDVLQRSKLPIQPVFTFGGICIGVGSIISSSCVWAQYFSTPSSSSSSSPLSSPYSQFSIVLYGAIIVGVGIGLTGFTASGICVLWFNQNRGTMLLLAMAGQGLGGFVYCNLMQQVLNYYTDEYDGKEEESWRPAMRLSGIVSMILAILASTVMRLPKEGEVEAYEKQYLQQQQQKGDKDDETTPSNSNKNEQQSASSQMDEEAEAFKFIEDTWGTLGLGNVPEEKMISDEKGNDEETTTTEMTPLKSSDQPRTSRSITAFMSQQRRSSVLTLSRSLNARSFQSSLSRRFLSVGNLSTTSTGRSSSSSSSIGHRPSYRSSNLAEFEALAHLPVNYITASFDALPDEKRMDEPIPGLPYLSTSQAFYTRTSLSLLGWCFFSCFAYTNYVVHLPAFATSVGLSPGVGAAALSLTGLTMLIGNITLGRVTDIIGPIRILQGTMMILMIIFFVWPYGTSSIQVTILACLYGYAATTQGSAPLIIMADAFGSTSPDSILTLLGILNFAKFPGYLFGPTICGWLYERNGDYFSASEFTGIMMLIGNLFLFAIPSTEEQIKALKK